MEARMGEERLARAQRHRCRQTANQQLGELTHMSETSLAAFERIIKALPSCVYYKDTEGKYVFATHHWSHIEHGDDPNWSIKGKTDLDIRKNKENALLAMEQDRRILETGEGVSYVIQEKNGDRIEYLELVKNPVRDDDGNIVGIVGLINNITEQELMRQKLERHARTDDMTGLFNRRAFDEWVRDELPDATYPISVIAADCDHLKMFNDSFGHAAGDELIRSTALLLDLAKPSKALAFRVGGDEFSVIVPDCTREQADEIVEKMFATAKTLSVEDQPISVSVGIATMESPDEDFRAVLRKADLDMYDYKRRHHEYLREIYG